MSRILILGGTQFIGVHMTQIARRRGHIVTLFSRGRTHPELFPDIEKLRGDRDGQLDALQGRQWDAVIDNSGYLPRHVRLSAELLSSNVGRYLFVSTVAVYANRMQPNDEHSLLRTLADGSVESVDAATYGPLKVLCEKVVQSSFGDRATIVRPGYIVGPDDWTDRFTYWPARAVRGGDMLAPGSPRDPIQYIDVRDFSRFALDAIERNVTGVFNVVTAPGQYTMGRLVDASIAAARSVAGRGPAPRPIWVPAKFLAQCRGVSLTRDFPIWISANSDAGAAPRATAARANDAGLTITPIETTVRDTLAWHLARPALEQAQLQAGIPPDRERDLFALWRREGS